MRKSSYEYRVTLAFPKYAGGASGGGLSTKSETYKKLKRIGFLHNS